MSDEITALRAQVAALTNENEHLRASVANSGVACIYCNLPKSEWSKCSAGFPGCDRADDAMLCPNVGASLEAEEQVAALQADAERYRWLRANADGWFPAHYDGYGMDRHEITLHSSIRDLDAAIDAVRKQEG